MQKSREIDLVQQKYRQPLEIMITWFTKHIARSIGMSHPEVYSSLDALEEKKGPLSVLYSQGFDRSHRDDLVLRLLQEQLGPLHQFQHVWKYGSSNPTSDIDLLLVTDNDIDKDKIHPYFDINIVSNSELKHLLYHKDMNVTIPILNGTILKGSQEELTEYRKLIDKPISQQEYLEHMNKRAHQAIELSDTCARINSPTNLYRATTNLSYAAMYVHQAEKPVPSSDALGQEAFENLLEKRGLIRASRDLSKKMKNISVQLARQEYLRIRNMF